LSHTFDALIDSYIDQKVGVVPAFLTQQLAADLRENLLALFSKKQFHQAGIGNNAVQAHDQLIRKDQIYWLDRAHESASENAFFEVMDHFVLLLNQTCYTGITNYEFHYTMYEIGSFYKKHIDQFDNNKNRAFSMIIYLNPDWQLGDGGELCIHHADFLQTIAPLNQQCVFFKSDEMMHEVLRTNAARLSITGWLRVD
jgi:SM-20-related protein